VISHNTAAFRHGSVLRDLMTELLKDGTTNATIFIRLNNEEKYRQEMEAFINEAFLDLPINIMLKWKKS
jgi:hypothetical protein